MQIQREEQRLHFYTSSPMKSRLNLRCILSLSLSAYSLSPSAFSLLWSFDSFFLQPITRSLVPRYRETVRTQRGGMNERIGTMKREQRARTSVDDPPSGIARLICPITLNNPRDNSIAWVSWDRSRGRPALSQLSAICECKFPFPRYTRIARLTTRN